MMTSVKSYRHSPQVNHPIWNEKHAQKGLRLGLYEEYRDAGLWADYSVYQNDATGVGVTRDADPFVRGIYFDGVDDYYNIPNSDSLNIESEISIGCWIKLPYTSSSQFMISKYRNEYDASYELYCSPAGWGGLKFRLYDELGGHSVASSIGVMNDIYHLCVGTLVNGTQTLYLDGVSCGFTSLPTEYIEPTTADLKIGCRGSPASYLFDRGYISNVFITDHGMSADDVNNLYQNERKYYGV